MMEKKHDVPSRSGEPIQRSSVLSLTLLSLMLVTPALAQNQQTGPSAAELTRALAEQGAIALPAVRFDAGKATLVPESLPVLAVVGDVLTRNPSLRLEIQGHIDSVGQSAANQTLSQARAAAVRDYLIKTFGIVPGRLTAVGFGDTKPIADNSSASGRRQNSRIELVNMDAKEWTGRVSAGMMAIGGETTGFVIIVGQDRFELQPADEAMRRQLRALSGKVATVRGTLETREGVEVKTRRVIKVTAVEEN